MQKNSSVAADLRTRGASYVDTAVADLDDTDKHPQLLAHAVNSLTRMDIAYLAHGILGDQAEAEQDFNTAAQILYTNLMAPISLLTWLANFCVQRRAGTLAVISSVAGDRGRKSNYVMDRRRQVSKPSWPACATAWTAKASPSSPSSLVLLAPP